MMARVEVTREGVKVRASVFKDCGGNPLKVDYFWIVLPPVTVDADADLLPLERKTNLCVHSELWLGQ